MRVKGYREKVVLCVVENCYSKEIDIEQQILKASRYDESGSDV